MLEIWICDARGEAPKITPFLLTLAPNEKATVGLALQKAGIATGPNDPVLARKAERAVLGYLASVRIGIVRFMMAIAWSCIPPY